MKEIGGYLELERFEKNEYHKGALALNSARNALSYLCKHKNISKVYIPYYLCDSVYKVCQRDKIDYEFYHIGDNFMPLFDHELSENEYLYVVNYFGQIDNEKIKFIKQKFKNIIVDNVQSFFSLAVSGVDTIYSCRKFFGVPDGAYLVGNTYDESELNQDVSINRVGHLLGRLEAESASSYYDVFKSNDELFDTLKVMRMSKFTQNILNAVNYSLVIQKRNENWDILHNALKDKNKLTFTKPNGAYMYPYYIKNGELIRKELSKKGIYIPTLWPNVMSFDNCDLEKDYAKNILPLPIDQRYDITDMNVILRELNNVKG